MMLRIANFAIASALLLAGCQQPAGEGERVLARVGEEVITVAEFERELARRAEGRSRYFQQADNRRALLEEMVRHRMLVQEAHAAGIADEPEFRDLFERMLIQRLREKRLDEELRAHAPDEAEVAAYYEANLDSFSRPARRQMAMIRVDVPADAETSEREAMRSRAEAAREAAADLPEDVGSFDTVAVEYSDDRSSRYRGGIVGWLVDGPQRRYQWPDAVLDTAFELEQPGQMSPVIETPEAFYLLRLVSIEPGRVQPLEQVADGIRHRLERERARELESSLFADIAGRRNWEIDEAALESVEPPGAGDEEVEPQQGPPPLPSDAVGPAQ